MKGAIIGRLTGRAAGDLGGAGANGAARGLCTGTVGPISGVLGGIVNSGLTNGACDIADGLETGTAGLKVVTSGVLVFGGNGTVVGFLKGVGAYGLKFGAAALEIIGVFTGDRTGGLTGCGGSSVDTDGAGGSPGTGAEDSTGRSNGAYAGATVLATGVSTGDGLSDGCGKAVGISGALVDA